MLADPAERLRALNACADVVAQNTRLLTDLDAAIGDGDHGTNMSRGFKALKEAAEDLIQAAPGAMLQRAGTILVATVGGASGPLYGSLLMAMGKAAGTAETLDLPLLTEMLSEGVSAVGRRGKASPGEKTLLDVLVPVRDALKQSLAHGARPFDLAHRVADTAEQALEATRPLRATKGRASFLGERSIGHLDPGAASARLLVSALCQLVGEER